MPDPLQRRVGRLRVLLVFAPGEDDPALTEQRRILASAAHGARQRDLVVVEIVGTRTSGPAMKGTAQKHKDRLTVTINETTLQDGRTVPADAVLMAPDSKETAIASSVDHHHVPRIVLPTLAAGIQGLGQALALSGSSVFSGPYGAAQNFNTFNGGQLAGIAAGTAAGQLNQVQQQQTPKQSTVNLAAEVDVGIMFLAPVEDGP